MAYYKYEYQYNLQVEELRQKEVMKEEIVERKIPQVKSMYPFSGQGIELGKGEVNHIFYAFGSYLL